MLLRKLVVKGKLDSDAQLLCRQNVLLLYAQTVEGYGKNLTDL